MTATDLRSPYCSRCGGPKTDGCCRTCRADAGRGPFLGVRAPRTRHRSRLVVIALAVTLGASAVLAGVDARRDLSQTSARLADVQRQLAGLREQLSTQTTVSAGLDGRVRGLESKANGQPDPAVIAKRAGTSVFTVVTDDGSGSGFVVSAANGESRLVTNFHVVASTYVNGRRSVRVKQGDLTYSGRISRVSEANDLAVVTLPLRLPALAVAHGRPQVGDPLLVLGSPLGLAGTVTSGIVSAYRRSGGTEYLQFSAPISPGNSGGPVVDRRGEVVGVSVAKIVAEGAEGLSFAIPAATLCPAVGVC